MGARILEWLESEGYLGPDGGISRLESRINAAFASLDARLPGVITARSGLGAMQAFVAWDGDAEVTAKLVNICLDEGVLFQTAGSSPTKIRLLPPLCLTEVELESAFASLERALRRVSTCFDLAIGASLIG